MAEPPASRILQIGTSDQGGGAAAVARNLMQAYRRRGCRVWHAVGQKHGTDGDVLLLPDDRRAAFRLSGYSALQIGLRQLAGRHPRTGWGFLSRSLRSLTHPLATANTMRGVEDFEFSGTYSVIDSLGAPPDVVHCHNLHGGYFDLRALSWLSRRMPTVLTLHDMWLITGHCAHSLDCERWQMGCGQCPDLSLYPAVRRDATAENWKRKRDIYQQSRLYVATPSQWLLEKLEQSMLLPAVRDARVVPNGVDLSVFRPADRRSVRAKLGLPIDAKVVLLTTGGRRSMWKDDRTVGSTISQLAERGAGLPILVVVLGRGDGLPQAGEANVRCVPYQADPQVVATYYQAADVYVHAARADTFPLAILEALACGTPVVATAVGGVPEQIFSAAIGAVRSGNVEVLGNATGILVPPGDADSMTDAVLALLMNDRPRERLGDNAARDARARFDLEQQVEQYLAWYRTIIEDWKTPHSLVQSDSVH